MADASLDTVSFYDANADAFAAKYESLSPADVHANIVDLIPSGPGWALDVGAGSGRDAAWLVSRGYDVVAVEPAPASAPVLSS
jgi:SAM-dependent methyltransferase